MKKIDKKSWEGVCKKVAFLSVVSLLLNVSMVGVFFAVPEAEGAPAPIENEEICEAAVDVVLIMDRSGSMGWEIPTRLSQAKIAANIFLDNLGADDQSAIVSYASEAVLDKELSNDHPVTQTAVNNLAAKGGTNIGDAIYLSNEELGSARINPQAVKAAILLTDGRATCPYYNSERYGMCGFVEDAEDIAYTLDAAKAAADLGYKIFTIGLGREYKINEEMLQEIAETTGAEYYHAPNSDDLESIYESIRWQLCEYGSISGCKYNDINNDGDKEDFTTEDVITDWEIILTGETNGPITQLTDENGCYQFSGLLPGSYTVSEGGKDGITDFVQTYPRDPSLSYSITLGSEETLTGYDFSNYFPVCGNEILDNDFGESCDDGNIINGDGCSSECLFEDDSVCGNGVQEGSEECDGTDGVGDHQTCINCVLADLTYCGDGVQQTPNDEGTGGPLNDGNEECDGEEGAGANQTCSASCVLLESLCRVKLDTVIIMDRSGSMGWEIPTRLGQAKTAANSFVGKLGSDDRSALVSFSTTAGLDKPFSNNHSTTQTMTNSLTAVGATNIGDAIGLANDEFLNSAEDVLKVEILLTDGRANQPNGNGFDEDPADVAYAEEKATNAALTGIKIFTVGLGNDINETMLQNIADSTGAQYYNAPTADELEEIFSEIAYDICQYGSISGCKYETDNEGNNEETISGWKINLTGDTNLTQLTNGNGCYSFTGLLGGNYTVSEGGKDGAGSFIQTYPQNPLFYDIVLNDEEEATGYDFGNYFPVCGNGVLDSDEECDDGNNIDGDSCSSLCNIESSDGGGVEPVCGDSVVEGTEECDDGNTTDGDGCSSLCKTESSDNPINAGDIVINEIMQNPAAVGDTASEWFELYNTTANPVCLDGCIVRNDDGNDSFTIVSLTVAGGEYAVLSNNDDIILNGGVNVDYKYSGFTLGNGDDEIIIECEGTIIDEVRYDDGTDFPDPAGASMILNDPLNDNNVGSNWCVSIASYGDGDLGTPGSQNDSCGGDGSGDPVCVDDDGDSYGLNCPAGNDCDDTNAAVNLGATEICDDQIDNDCDMAVDCDDDDCDSDPACSSGDDPATPDVIINEVAWMGTDISDNDEWIELRNMTSEVILLDEWTLDAQDGSLSIILEGGISANGYYLLERSNDLTVLDVLADKIYIGALGNDGEFLELRKANSILVDKVDASSGWSAGENAKPKHPMERCADDNWYDSDVAGGTPKAENGCSGICADSDGDGVYDDVDNCPNVSNPGQEDSNSNGTGDACETIDPVCVDSDGDGYGTGDTTSCPNAGEDCNDTNPDINPGATETCDGEDNNCNGEIDEGCGSSSVNAGDVIINELMWMGSWTSPTGDEWIELRNTTDLPIDLSGCQLTKLDSEGAEELMLTIPDGGSVDADGFYLISNYDEDGSNISAIPDLVDTAVNLSNTKLQIKLYCGGDWNGSGALIDTAGDGSAPLTGDNGNNSEDPVISKKSMSRKGVPGDGSLADSWYTALTSDNWDAEATEWGTPGNANSM